MIFRLHWYVLCNSRHTVGVSVRLPSTLQTGVSRQLFPADTVSQRVTQHAHEQIGVAQPQAGFPDVGHSACSNTHADSRYALCIDLLL